MRLLRDILPEEVLARLALCPPPTDDAGPDIRFWQHSAKGVCTVASAYQVLERGKLGNPDSFWKKIWAWNGPQRVRCFLWLAAQQRLLTNYERARRHMSPSNLCPLCDDAPETTLHGIRDCPFAVAVWKRLVKIEEQLK